VCEALGGLTPGLGAGQVSDLLVRLALAAGSDDNCSAAVIRIGAPATP
jgi:hypothetical protein